MALKGIEAILLGDINVRLMEPREIREDELASALVDSRLGNMTEHFTPRRRYRGKGSWMRQMSREGRLVTGRGDCILR